MSRVAVIVHPDRPSAVELAAQVARSLTGSGHDVRLPIDDAARIDASDLGYDDDVVGKGCDIAVSIGGDGTMLRTFELVAQHGVPVLGVNQGELGYLTEFEAHEMDDALPDALAGRMATEERMMLDVVLARTAAPSHERERWLALNEAVVEKTSPGHTVHLAVDFDDARLTTYAADGLIVATPTGSTAYSMSVRGAIVAPTHRSLQLTPVAPHMLFDRPLVVDPTTEIRIEVLGHRGVTLSVDGRGVAELDPGDAVVATEATVVARLLTTGRRRFQDVLKAKFGLQDR